MKRVLIAGLFVFIFLSSTFVSAADVSGIDTFMLLIKESLGNAGYQAMSDYRYQVISKCGRDVTQDELTKFGRSNEYSRMLMINYSMGPAGRETADYRQILINVECNLNATPLNKAAESK